MWRASVLTLFPQMFPGPLAESLAGKAHDAGKWALDVYNIRDYALDKHQTVDDRPFGGGAGMVMRPDVMARAIEQSLGKEGQRDCHLMYMSPRGKPFTQQKARELVEKPHVAFVCGRYEGLDQRVIDHFEMEELSMGDFILSGGEIAAMTVIDACLRLISGVIMNRSVNDEESFGETGRYTGLLEYPHYTRPASWNGLDVPEVLLSGHHAEIESWRLRQAEAITRERRSDLWSAYHNVEEKQE